jgi:hypothetical protein
MFFKSAAVKVNGVETAPLTFSCAVVFGFWAEPVCVHGRTANAAKQAEIRRIGVLRRTRTAM